MRLPAWVLYPLKANKVNQRKIAATAARGKLMARRKKVEPEITAEQREKLMHVQSLVAQAECIAESLTQEKIVMPSDRGERAGSRRCGTSIIVSPT